MLPAFLTQRFMTGVVREFPVQALPGMDILPLEGVASMEVVYDVILKDAKLAPFVAINAESPLADKEQFARVIQELACVRQKELLNEDDLLALREPGTPDMIMDGLAETRRSVAERKFRQTSDRMTARVWGRVCWMIWQALQGSVAYDDKKVIFTVDFAIPTTHKITLTGTNQWSDTTNADPIANLNTWMELIDDDAGRTATRCYVGKNVPGYLSQSAKVRDLLKYNGQIERVLSNNEVMNYIGNIMNLKLSKVSNTYQNDSGVDTRFLGDDYIIMMPEPRQADGEVLGDMMTGPAKANNFQTGIYGWVKEEEDPWATYIGAGIHAFPRLYHPKWIVVVNVKGGAG